MKQLLFLLILAQISFSCYAQSGYVRDAMYDKYGRDHEKKGEDWVKNAMSGKVDPEYKFPLMVKMHNTSYKRGEVRDESDITYYVNNAANKFGMRAENGSKKKKEDMLIIYDYIANSMIMLNETDMTGMAMNLNAFMSGDAIAHRNQGKADKQETNNDCKKTGKTKIILGYNCEQYVCVNKDDNTRSEMWVTTKLIFDMSKTAGRGAMTGLLGYTRGVGGMMMESEFYKNDDLEMKMEVTKVNPNENTVVKTTDYRFSH
ncbi:MAG: hypothetical protein JST52_02065 [Bacteroidetes bacterium]|nr:hypothetical protein [Bacteroidota bacterium]